MKFETLKKDNKKKIAIGIIAVISITLVGVFATTFAKYKLTQSIPLAKGTINYKAYDFKIMAMYEQKDGSNCTEDNCYNEISTMPSASNYKINENKSYCTLDNKNKDNKAIIKTENGKHIISNLSKQNKCYLYFDKSSMNGSSELLSRLSVKYGTPNFTGVATTDEGIYGAQDNDGTSYYWRGAVTNNYLTFAGKWWRIIRINGDGTIRIIYDGTAYHANGSSTTDSQIGTSAFNTNYNDNAYVGFMYGSTGASTYEATHTNTNKSTILTSLETWYNNNLATYASKIDTNAGFCGDRSINTGSTSWLSGDTKKGFGTNVTVYGPFSRILNSGGSGNSTQTPTFNCPNSNDLYTMKGATKGNKALDKPIGLITADEVIYAGGFGGQNNTSYYLRNGSNYWTMSPYNMNANGAAHVFCVDYNGYLGDGSVYGTYGVRPVINIRADVSISGSGTSEDPFVVN